MLALYKTKRTKLTKVGTITSAGVVTGDVKFIRRLLKSADVKPTDRDGILALSGSYIVVMPHNDKDM